MRFSIRLKNKSKADFGKKVYSEGNYFDFDL